MRQTRRLSFKRIPIRVSLLCYFTRPVFSHDFLCVMSVIIECTDMNTHGKAILICAVRKSNPYSHTKLLLEAGYNIPSDPHILHDVMCYKTYLLLLKFGVKPNLYTLETELRWGCQQTIAVLLSMCYYNYQELTKARSRVVTYLARQHLRPTSAGLFFEHFPVRHHRRSIWEPNK